MSEKITTQVNVDLAVSVDVTARITADTDQDQEHDLTPLALSVSILAGAGALGVAFWFVGVMAFVGLAGLVATGGAVMFLYDYGPDLLNDWHYRRVERQRSKQLAAARPLVIVVSSQEEAQKLLSADKAKLLEQHR